MKKFKRGVNFSMYWNVLFIMWLEISVCTLGVCTLYVIMLLEVPLYFFEYTDMSCILYTWFYVSRNHVLPFKELPCRILPVLLIFPAEFLLLWHVLWLCGSKVLECANCKKHRHTKTRTFTWMLHDMTHP